jgi:hypothetical protein
VEEGGPHGEPRRREGIVSGGPSVDEGAGEGEPAPEEVALREPEPAVDGLGAGRAEDEVGHDERVALREREHQHHHPAGAAPLDPRLDAREPAELEQAQAGHEHRRVIEDLALAQGDVVAHRGRPGAA